MSLFSELSRLEQELLKPGVRSDPSQVSSLLADDFIEIGASGKRFSKVQVMADLHNECASKVYRAENFELKRLAVDIVMLLYIGISEKQGSKDYSKRCSIWRKQHNQWQMIYHQGTLCPDGNV